MCSTDKSILYADVTVLVYAGTLLKMFIDHVNGRLSHIKGAAQKLANLKD